MSTTGSAITMCGNGGFATFDSEGPYRYWLQRTWDNGKPHLDFIMLNPSIGDENRLETTTAGAASRAVKWGYGGIRVVNLFALISVNPKYLLSHPDPVGPLNDEFLDQFINGSEQIICAWGKSGTFRNRDKEVLSKIPNPYCLGVNKDGTPKHPLHMSHSEKPRRYVWT